VVKYGNTIGTSTRQILAGDHVHTHNLHTALSDSREYSWQPSVSRAAQCRESLSFSGYRRADGRAGIRNEIWIVSTVGCVNAVARRIADEGAKRFSGEGVDALAHFEHPYGCSQLGDDQIYTQKILAGLVRHPNAGGVLVLGLGCENNNIESFRSFLNDADLNRVRFLNAQSCGNEVESALSLVGELAAEMKNDRRTDIPASELVVGLKCGGSDGFSGISANPLLGFVSDRIVSCGGTTVLSEVPEMFGAEHLLMARAKDEKTFRGIAAMINGFKEYFLRHGQPVYENPSPGNKEGGITTLEEKSLGCVQKGGSSPVQGVVRYGGRIEEKGLILLESPGNDIVAVSALASAGCHILLFTTGRGTPLGSPVPVIKVSTTTELAERKSAWIDFDAGPALSGKEFGVLADELLEVILRSASGAKTKSEQNGFRDFAIFKDGVTL
ncbi:MAG: UxaA family hydrolase, partial [Spirochaetota bacterium]